MTENPEGLAPHHQQLDQQLDQTIDDAQPNKRWNWVWIDLEERTSEFGPGYETRAEAIRATRSVIQDIAADFPEFRPAALAWIRGETTDNTVIGGPHGYALYTFDVADDAARKTEAAPCLQTLADRAGVKLPKTRR